METKELEILVIDREQWLTGEAVRAGAVKESSLLDSETGLMCCLGFACLQAGCSVQSITDVGAPDGLCDERNQARAAKGRLLSSQDEWGYHLGHPACDPAIAANDRRSITRETREARVAKALAKMGYEVVFVGDYPNYKQMAKARKSQE